MNKLTKRNPGIVYHIFMIAFSLLMLYPLIWMISSSFKETKEIMTTLKEIIPSKPTLKNYVQAWGGVGRSTFMDFFWNSMFVATMRVIGNVLSSAMTAFAFARIKFAGRKIFFAIMISTMCLPGMVLQVPTYLLYNALGWVGSFKPLFVTAFLGGGAFNIFLLIQFMKNVNRSTDESAVLDGCNWIQLFWYIMLPLVKPVLATVAVLTFIGSWGDFYSALIYLNKPDMYPIAFALKLFADETTTNYGPMLAMSVLSLIPIIVLFFIFQRSLVEGISTTGMKG